MHKLLSILVFAAILPHSLVKSQSYTFTIFSDSVSHKMQGGIGASWHAISDIGPLENHKFKYPVREDNPLGSAWGGNPPLQNKEAWQQLCNHAQWLGLDFVRVELLMRDYEPHKGQFDWNSYDMQALYRILDCCQKIGADVFLQQMSSDVDWNSYNGVHPLLSAPYSVNDFAEGIAALLDNLINTHKYSCIKYFCITNEPPGGTWGYWWSAGQNDAPFEPVLKRVHEVLIKRNITTPLSGPDWTSLPPFDKSKLSFDPWLGSYDIHSYDGINENGARTIHQWAQWAHSKNKPFFISEFGNMNLGWGKDNPGPKSLAAALSNAHDMIVALSNGTDGMNRWSFVNRGDMDGQWQLVRTWDKENKKYLNKIDPENTSYYGFAMFSRFIAKYASILKTVSPSDTVVSALSLKNPDGNLVIILLNQSSAEIKIKMNIKSNAKIENLYEYRYDNTVPSEGDFALNPLDSLSGASFYNIILKQKSITVLTTRFLKNTDKGIIK